MLTLKADGVYVFLSEKHVILYLFFRCNHNAGRSCNGNEKVYASEQKSLVLLHCIFWMVGLDGIDCLSKLL